MAKNLEPQCKQCRRIGEKLFLKGEKCSTPKCPLVKRPYPPGIHGPKGKKRQTDYGLQLQEKQKAKKFYGLTEKQFKLTLDNAKKKQGDAGENFLKLLEMRLDNILYRLGFASSHFEARQLVNHGHFLINNKKVNIPSYNTKTGEMISLKSGSRRIKAFASIEEKLKNKNLPSWLNLDLKELSAKILHEPTSDDLKSNINIPMIIEFYSR
jgi:small subunit ribosomal protein S4